MDIKPITQSTADLGSFNPKHYLQPFKFQDQKRDLSVNNLHANTLFNRKIAALPSQSDVRATPAKELRKPEDFAELKKFCN